MKIVKSNEVPWEAALNRGAYANRRKNLGGGEHLACGLWELAPGKKSFPMHVHHVADEALYVLSGTGKVRTTEGESPIGPGDFVSFPAGGVAHQLVNDGSDPLVYVGISTPMGSDVVEYPESDKVATSVGKGPTAKRFIFRKGAQVDYLADDKDA